MSSNKINITNTLVSRTKPAEKPVEIWDAGLKGLILRVQPTGVKTYYLQYKRGNRVKVGPADALSPEQARDIAKGMLAEHYQGDDPIEKRRRVDAGNYLQFLNDVYRPWLQLNLVHGDYAYGTLVKGFPELHKLALCEITPSVIEKWRTRRLKEGLDPNTVNRQLSDLKACLHRARDIWEMSISERLNCVKPSKIDRSPKVRYLTVDEEKRLRSALDAREDDLRSGVIVYVQPTDLSGRTFADHLKPAVIVSLNTGLRRGELLKLKWEDVHFERALLTVVGITSKTGKTRHIPLNAEALATLKAWKEQPGVKNAVVFTGPNGQPLHDMRTAWEGILKRAKINNFKWHDMRHTFASKLVMSGVDLNTVRELLGHADYKMTLRYAHLAPEHKAAAVATLCIKQSS